METFGGYNLIKKIGVGGMAEVFLAEKPGPAGFEKKLVLKRILPYFTEDEKFITMFLDEARLAAKLQHPNIVQIFDLGEVEGTYFIAMEYIHGQAMDKIIARHRELGMPIPLTYAAKIVTDVCAGLHHAHTYTTDDGTHLNLVHRDMSPENILISYRGEVKIIDFGVAKAKINQTKTQAGAIKGKLCYMSPEQIRGKELDRRSDIFAMGIVLYELTTGNRPFGGDSDLEVVSDIITKQPRPPELFLRNYPPQLSNIINKALQKEPSHRYQSADELHRALNAFMQEQGAFITNNDLGEYVKRLFGNSSEDIEFIRIKSSEANIEKIGKMGPFSPPPESAQQPPYGVQSQVSVQAGYQPYPQVPSQPVYYAPPQTPSQAGYSPQPQMPQPGYPMQPQMGPSPGQQWPGAPMVQAGYPVYPEARRKSNALLWILLVIILLGVFGGGGYFAYITYFAPTKEEDKNGTAKKDIEKTGTDRGVSVVTGDKDVTEPSKKDTFVQAANVEDTSTGTREDMAAIAKLTDTAPIEEIHDTYQVAKVEDTNKSSTAMDTNQVATVEDTYSGIKDTYVAQLIKDTYVSQAIQDTYVGKTIQDTFVAQVVKDTYVSQQTDAGKTLVEEKKGTLIVQTEPILGVYLDHKLIGNSPVEIAVPEGQHKVSLKGQGLSHSLSVDIVGGETKKSSRNSKREPSKSSASPGLRFI